MIDQPTITDTPRTAPEADPRVPVLEERVRHLEEAVAALQDTRALEQRVVERVTAQVAPAAPNGVRESAGLLLEAGRQLLPAVAAAAEAPAPPAQPQPAAPPLRRPWVLFDVYAELRALLRMYLDPRFRLTWSARVVPAVLVAAIATSWLWLPGTTLLDKLSIGIASTLYVKAVDLLLAFVLFKVLHREVTRYRNTSPDLPPSLRL